MRNYKDEILTLKEKNRQQTQLSNRYMREFKRTRTRLLVSALINIATLAALFKVLF
jgi:hypothetical protein